MITGAPPDSPYCSRICFSIVLPSVSRLSNWVFKLYFLISVISAGKYATKLCSCQLLSAVCLLSCTQHSGQTRYKPQSVLLPVYVVAMVNVLCKTAVQFVDVIHILTLYFLLSEQPELRTIPLKFQLLYIVMLTRNRTISQLQYGYFCLPFHNISHFPAGTVVVEFTVTEGSDCNYFRYQTTGVF